MSLGLGAAALIFGHTVLAEEKKTEKPKGQFKREEIARHNTIKNGVWVYYRGGVYDITSWVENHPGGKKIMLAAGGPVEGFFRYFKVHDSEHVKELMEEYRIGDVHPDDLAASEAEAALIPPAIANDPFSLDPERDPNLVVLTDRPCNAETPPEILGQSYLTPNHLFYVRNHMNVPVIDIATYRLRIEGESLKNNKTVELSLEDIQKIFPKREIVAVLQCAGNRREDMSRVKPARGLQWKSGAIGNAKWAGAALRDVLIYAGVDPSDLKGAQHVHFEGLDWDGTTHYQASIPIDKAISPEGDVLLAYEMNNEPLPRDHGFPLRAVVPGITGARNVKWLGKIVLAPKESESIWQKKDYKVFPQTVNWENIEKNYDSAVPIQGMPVQSAILEPREGQVITPNDEKFCVKGYAWSGSGRAITRVEISLDGGQNWQPAQITAQPPDDSPSRRQSWGWTLWQLCVPQETLKSSPQMQIVCRAVDVDYNTQPESAASIWNVRGLLNNSWQRINVTVASQSKQ